ncbi:MAG TPA: M3 family oligoendopeptidase [Planctomycetota bacterium]|nr:M3 family oligoendopeptidase [Planctomycetota bacterium]
MSGGIDRIGGATWDLAGFFPSFDGPEMRSFRERLAADVKRLIGLAAALGPLTDESAGRWEEAYLLAEDCSARLGHIFAYVGCLSAADAADERYGAEEARLAGLGAEFSRAGTDLLEGLKAVPDAVFERFVSRERLAPVAYSVRRDRVRARRRMSPAEEKLAGDLGVDGLHAWGRLYDKLSGKLEFEMRWPDGRVETLPISRWRSLMNDPDRAVGRAAFQGGNRAWKRLEDVCAAALNAIVGTRLKLQARRGMDGCLEEPLFDNGVERATLEAMYRAVHGSADLAREILRVKAGKLGRRSIEWFERDAPLPAAAPGGEAGLSWEEGAALVGRAFSGAYPALGGFFRQALERRWVESEPRSGKRPGAFCTGSPVTGETRVYMTYNGALNDATTLAHEIGHAWHGELLRDLRPPAREYPMTLAETASVFAEQILAEGLYADPAVPAGEKLRMLDAELSGAAVMLLDITVRFEFEKAFCAERAGGELSPTRCAELMTSAQRRVFGDALAEGGEDPLFWASKLHFYMSGLSFYNFPYTFGFLMARELCRRFRAEGAAFLPAYERFLRLSGSAAVEEVAARSLGADIRREEFWAAAIRSLEEPLERFRAAPA